MMDSFTLGTAYYSTMSSNCQRALLASVLPVGSALCRRDDVIASYIPAPLLMNSWRIYLITLKTSFLFSVLQLHMSFCTP